MVLEPLGAFALACNVLQLVDSGAKVLGKAAEYRTTSDGRLSEQRHLRTILESLGGLNDDLRNSLSAAQGPQGLTVAEQRLMEANQECLAISQDFIVLLDSLKVANPQALLESILKSVRSLRYREKIEAMDKRLARAKDNLNLSLLIYMNSNQSDHATQSDIVTQSSRLEGNLLRALTSSSTLVHDQVEDLAQRIEGMNFASVQPAFSDFVKEHRQSMHDLSRQLDTVCAMHNAMRAQTEDLNHQQALQSLTESLYFPQLHDRRDRIQAAYHDTYRWILRPEIIQASKWDNLVAWLDDPQPRSNIYWISSKPGAGKSSLLRFLDEHLDPNQHMQSWLGYKRVIKTQYYFWNPGNILQKSVTGLLRTVLYQLLDELPDVFPRCVPSHKWKMAHNASSTSIVWTDHELKQCLRNVISSIESSASVLLLIDGLDEIEGDDDIRDELVEMLSELTLHSNVKACISSRRWTVFLDAFAMCPQMQLEDLNAQDIHTFVRGQLLSHPRYLQMLRYDTTNAESLMDDVVRKAEGVFLWVRLVVKDLLHGLRDGDSIRGLHQILEQTPTNLGQYFDRLMDSIEPHHRQEACALLQLALYDEPMFITLHKLRLMDLIFIEDAGTDFELRTHQDIGMYSFHDEEALYYKMESTLRKLFSRCKGLLECYYRFGSITFDLEYEDGIDHPERWLAHTLDDAGLTAGSVTRLPSTLIPILRSHKYVAFDFEVDFMHRSLREYLLEPDSQQFLNQYTGGRFDARNYLRNARLLQIFMCRRGGLPPSMIVGMASYFISTLSIPPFRGSTKSAQFAARFQHTLDYVKGGYRISEDHWYISRSFEAWLHERNNSLTLAIDFALTGYLAQVLTADAIRTKLGRPVLDYVLRPRFTPATSSSMKIGNQYPIPELVQSLLSLGADPNEEYEGIALWPLFLSFVVDTSIGWSGFNGLRRAYLLSLEAMIRAGADTSVAQAALSAPANHGLLTRLYDWPEPFLERTTDADYLLDRWPGLARELRLPGSRKAFAVSDVLECFRCIFGNAIDGLKDQVCQRAAIASGVPVGNPIDMITAPLRE